MRIESEEPGEAGRERVTVVPESVDDLWHLSHVLEDGDLVSGVTTRRIQRNDETLRDTGGERQPMDVTVSVREVEWHKFANRLRVAGVIEACSREDQLGLHHTLNVEPFDSVTIEKVWKPDQRGRLEDAVAASGEPDVGIVTVEEGQAYVHTVSQYGTDEYASVRGSSGKGEYARARSELFAEVVDVLEHLDVEALILAGPGFTKQDAYAYIERHAPELAERMTIVDTSGVGDRGVHEVLKRGAVDEVVAESRIAEEAALIDELTLRIKRGDPAAFGPDAVGRAAEYGAVEVLLVVDERLRQERGGAGEWEVDVDAVIEHVEHQGGRVVVFSSEFDPANQLDGLGGIAALLRYRIE